jgi:hypothetical protein
LFVAAALRHYNHCSMKILSAGMRTPNDTAAVPLPAKAN